MSRPRLRWSDQDIEQTIGDLLRIGLLVATALAIVGGAIYLTNHGSEPPDYRLFRGEPADLRGIPGIVELARDWRGQGIIQLGLLVLLATPVVRVAFSIIAFVVQRDWLYVGITVFVMAVLLYSIVGGYL